MKLPHWTAQTLHDVTDRFSSWPGSKSAHKPSCFQKTSMQITSFWALPEDKDFQWRGISLSWLPWVKPATSFHTQTADSHNLGPPGIDTSGLTWKVRTKRLPHLRGKYLIESGILVAKGTKTSLHSFPPRLSKVPIHTNYGSSQGLWVLGTTPVESPLGAGLLKTCSEAMREGEDSILRVHCFFQWELL